MSEIHKTKKERLEELESKIHELRMKKLYTIEYLAGENKKIVETLNDMDSKAKEVQEKLLKSPPEIEVKFAYVILKTLEARKSVLDGLKQALRECRMALTLLIKEEGKIQYLREKLMSEAE